MLAIAEQIDEIGYHSLEAWGAEQLLILAFVSSKARSLGSSTPVPGRDRKTPPPDVTGADKIFLGYKHYPDDVVREFCLRAVDNGISIIRIFDALNDVRNMETAIKASKEAGAHVQGTISYTISPVHDIDSYVKLAKDLKELWFRFDLH